MKKPFKEEKTDLKIELKTVNIILFAFLLSQEIFSQTPINGFCKYNSFEVNPDYSSILTLNFNDDSYTDLLLYSPYSKKVTSLAGQVNGTFGKPEESEVPFQITNIQSLIEKNKVIKRFAFTSRENMKAGIYSFTSDGKVILSGFVKFKSYPENISTADANQNGRDEILISGSAFNGLSIISQSDHGLKEKKIIENTNFSEAIFADLRSDGYSDIAAINLFNNSLFFFYNNGAGKFNLVRTIPMNGPIHALKAADIDLDNYTDLLYATGKSIVIMFGDFASAYNRIEKIKTEYQPDQIITGDFNRDGKIDIAYINYKENILSVLFAKTDTTFYPEMIYLRKNNIRTLVPYYSKFINGIAALSSEGFLYTVTNLSSISSKATMVFSSEPSAISFFDRNNNGITDICYIDKFSTSLDLVVRNNAGIPSYFYRFPLYSDQHNILVDDSDPDVKIFYCYSTGKKLVEILKVNFDKNSYTRNSIYSPGNILDLKFQTQNNLNDKIYVAYNKNKQMGFSIIEYHDYRYTYTNYFGIANNPVSASISFEKTLKILYWYEVKNSMFLSKTVFIGGVESNVSNFIYTLNNAEHIIPVTGDLLNNDKEITVSFFQYQGKQGTVIYNDYNDAQINTKELPDYFSVTNSNQLFYGQVKPNGLNKLCVYLPEKKSLTKLDFVNKGKDFVVTKLADINNLESYFVKNMSYRSYNVVYVDSSANCIKIRQL